ncbi:MAG: ABC transporter ATP-binding protein, partial [Planctomycetota bacterium]
SFGERIGITGPNGTGKSTLLKGLLGELRFDAGEVRTDPKAQIGYYAQQSDDLEPQRTVLAEIRELRPDLGELSARSLLARFHFRGDDVFKPLGALSGGEQSRVRLLKLLLSSPNVLVLDEPTNHLDIPSREALERALADYPGAILAVSHDRYFLDRIARRLLVLRAGKHEHVRGNYTDYITRLEAASPDNTREKRASRKPADRKPPRSQPDRPRGRFDRMSLDALEEHIIALETELRDFDKLFADPDVYKDAQAVVRLRTRLEEVKRELEEAENAWNRRADEA